jgi:laccase
MHCHIAWHASQGLAMQLIETPDSIGDTVEGRLEEMEDTCNAWTEYYADSEHKQDDSGI